MRTTAVLASALVRSVTVLTDVCSAGGGGGGGGGEGGCGGGNGALPGGYGGGAGQVETEPEMPVRVVDQEQTVPPPTKILGPCAGSRECDATERLLQCKVGTSFSSLHGGILPSDRISNKIGSQTNGESIQKKQGIFPSGRWELFKFSAARTNCS